jgi:DNA (cytosine-5)-methyltransferase 1
MWESSQDVARVAFRLAASHPQTDLGNPPDPLDDLIFIILSGQTTEKLYESTFVKLKIAFPKWERLSHADPKYVATLLHGGGLARQKAAYLCAILKRVESDFKKASLSELLSWNTAEAERYLTALPGVGVKTARCVLMYTAGRDLFPADVHCLRILERLGWIKWRGRRGEVVADEAQNLVPPALRRAVHIGMVEHGRKFCRSRTTDCDKCSLAELCEHATEDAPERPTVIDLCCGAGGFSWGFMQAGFNVVLGVDQCKNALATYSANIPGSQTLAADVTCRTSLREIKRLVTRRPTVVVAGPPCQGFSRAGPRKAADPRNSVLRDTMRLAVALKPDVIVFENVLNVKAEAFIHHFENTMAVARRAGYRFADVVLRAEAFGVAQSRKRVLLIATRINSRETLVRALHALEMRPAVENLSVHQALRGIPTDTTDTHHFDNHEAMLHSARVIAKINRIKPGEGPLSYRKLHPDRLAKTLICGHRALPCHYAVPRTITAREAARIQGFPDEYRFIGSKGHQMQQVANAVPPRVALGVATTILSLLGVSVAPELRTLIENVLGRVSIHPSPGATRENPKISAAAIG